MGENRRRWNRKCIWDTNIRQHLGHPCTNFKCLSVICIINILSITVHYYFCVQPTHKPVITWSLWEQEFLHRLHYKMMSENLDIFCKCRNRLNLLHGDYATDPVMISVMGQIPTGGNFVSDGNNNADGKAIIGREDHREMSSQLIIIKESFFKLVAMNRW